MKNNFGKLLLCMLLALTQPIFSLAKAENDDQNKESATAKEANTEIQPNIGRMGDSAVVDVDEFEFSVAETKIWLSDHLQNVDKPARLFYEFIKAGSYEEGFTDAVYLDIHKINKDGSKDALLDFFTSDRRQSANRDNLTHINSSMSVMAWRFRFDVRSCGIVIRSDPGGCVCYLRRRQ